MKFATDTVTKVKLETTTVDGVTYKYKSPTVRFVFNPEPMPPGTIPGMEAAGQSKYVIGIVRSPRGLGDVYVQDWVRPMLMCPTPEFDWDVPVLPVAINVAEVKRLEHHDIMCDRFS